MSRYECPKCGSPDVRTERRPDGDSECQECGHKDKTANFDFIKACKTGCGKYAEGKQYEFCHECWWNQDPRNIKNGGTVDLEKHKMKDPKKDRPQSLPNKFIVETYKEDRGLKATVTNGFAMVSQKVQIKGLKLLADAFVNIGVTTIHYPIGSTVYIKEASLQSQAWAKQSFTSDAIEGEFMIVDQAHIEFVVNG
jgi:hypothetical protein